MKMDNETVKQIIHICLNIFETDTKKTSLNMFFLEISRKVNYQKISG